MPRLQSIDHLVLTVANIDASVDFYTTALGMTLQKFQVADGTTRVALNFGAQKINLHPADGPFVPHAQSPTPGSADLCFLTDDPLQEWLDHLSKLSVPILEGPVKRTGAQFPIQSIYFQDPDGNLIEVSVKA